MFDLIKFCWKKQGGCAMLKVTTKNYFLQSCDPEVVEFFDKGILFSSVKESVLQE